FARAVVNRLWYHLFGKGIVDPPDDIRESNPAVNDELLDALAKDFVAGGHDVKRLLRTILNSRTYQLSALSVPGNRADEKYFSHTWPRILTGEQVFDAVAALTEVEEAYPGYPAGTKAIQVIDNEAVPQFLKTFGRPPRESPCECER